MTSWNKDEIALKLCNADRRFWQRPEISSFKQAGISYNTAQFWQRLAAEVMLLQPPKGE